MTIKRRIRWAHFILFTGVATTVMASGLDPIAAGSELGAQSKTAILSTGLFMMAGALAVLWREMLRSHKELGKLQAKTAEAMTGLRDAVHAATASSDRMAEAAGACEAANLARLRQTQRIAAIEDAESGR